MLWNHSQWAVLSTYPMREMFGIRRSDGLRCGVRSEGEARSDEAIDRILSVDWERWIETSVFAPDAKCSRVGFWLSCMFPNLNIAILKSQSDINPS